jgi:hypothetical protein
LRCSFQIGQAYAYYSQPFNHIQLFQPHDERSLGLPQPALSRRRDYAQPMKAALLAWYGQNQRPLPWRETSDPYSILVSEVMLQQTQVGEK